MKKPFSNNFLDLIQRFFDAFKLHTHRAHKKIIHHAYNKKHHRLSYIHVLLLLILFYIYNITSYQQADDVNVPVTEAPIVIQNEPQVVPDQPQQESQTPIETPTETPTETITEAPIDTSTEVSDGTTETMDTATETIPGASETAAEIISNDATATEQGSGIMLAEGMLEGADLISGDEELFSGVLSDLSGEALYDISGVVVGEIHVESGDIIPVDMSGDSLLPQPLSVIYPIADIQINSSGFVQLDNLESVVTTGGMEGMTYCSRIAYENISSILKAGARTRKETNDYILQGDTDKLLDQGLIDYTLFELTGEQIQTLFSGSAAAAYGTLYDVYITFITNGTKAYHRIAVVYTDDEQWYALDPLRGAKITDPQIFSRYIRYYDDEADVHRYIGQAYSPSTIKEELTHYDNIAQLFQEVAREEILSGEILIGEIITGEQIVSTGTVDTGNIIPIVEETNTGTVPEAIPEIPSETPQITAEESLPAETATVTENIPVEVLPPEEEIVTGYFDTAYDKGAYADKILELQNMFARMQIYPGPVDGIYSDAVIESIYQYQLRQNIMTPQDSMGLRGYLGPKTRKALNASYVEYQLYKISLEQQIIEQNISTGTTSTPEILPTDTGTNDVIIPETGQETLDTIGTVSGVNMLVLFDPLANPLFFSGIIISGMDLSGSYISGNLVGLVFDTMDEKAILHYLYAQGYQTGVLTLLPVSAETLVGDMTLNFAALSGTLLVPILLQSTNELSGQVAEVQIPEGALLKTADGSEFTGELTPPEFIDPEVIQEQVEQEVISVIDVGSDEHIEFEDSSGNMIYATFRIPAPGMESGNMVDVYYSQDGEERNYLTDVEVQLIDDEPYAIFEANHFTQFYLGIQASDFVINNDAVYTTGTSVVLNNYVTTATQMRFGNTTGALASGSREPYASTKSWTLTAGTGLKTVYAEFDNGTTTVTVEDTITYLTQLISSVIVFNEDFSPANYYDLDWTRQGTDRDSIAGAACYGGAGNCAHGDGTMTEGADWILTDSGLIDLSGAASATMQVKVKGDTDFDPNDYFRVWCKNSAGTDVNIYEENGGDRTSNTTWYSREATVDPSCLIANARFKITQIANNNNEDVHVDDFVVIKDTPLANSGGVFATLTYSPDTFTTGNVVASLTGFSSGDVVVTNNNGSGVYVFTGNGSFTFELENSGGITGEVIATVDRIKKAILNFSTGMFYESSLNNGSITGNIIATLSSGAFSGAAPSNVTMTNIPAGLTGVFTLSGTNQMIISLSGVAASHTSENNISDISITFATGAFVNMIQNDVLNAITTGIAIQFLDPPGFISGQQLRIDGTLSGGQFYDRSPNHRATTGYGSISNSTRSGETVMGPFNGSNQYIAVGTYTLSNYSISARFKSSVVDSQWRTIVGSNGVDGLEISKSNDGTNRIVLYYNNQLTSTTSVQANKRYHVVMVKDSVGTKLYINGVLENSNNYTAGLTNLPLAIGRRTTSQYWSGNIDEVKIYDNAITATQVENLYMNKPSFVTTTVYSGTSTLTGLADDTKMTISLTISGTTYPATNNQNGTRTATGIGPLTSGIYNVQLNYMNVYGRTGMLMYTGGLIVSIQAVTLPLSITGPVNFDFGLRETSDQTFTIEKAFSGTSDYFQVIDPNGYDTGYYTTISISDITTASGDILPYTAIAAKALTGIVTLSGSVNPRVYSAITGVYQYFTASPLTFIKRDTAANGGVTGIYGLHTVWKIDIPALQNVGDYTGVITYTLY